MSWWTPDLVGLLVPREGCPYVGQASQVHPGVPGAGCKPGDRDRPAGGACGCRERCRNKCWAVGCASNGTRLQLAILARCWMPMSAQSFSVCAVRTPNYVWTVSF